MEKKTRKYMRGEKMNKIKSTENILSFPPPLLLWVKIWGGKALIIEKIQFLKNTHLKDVTHSLDDGENPLMSLLEEGDDVTSPMTTSPSNMSTTSSFMPSVTSPKIEMPQTPR